MLWGEVHVFPPVPNVLLTKLVMGFRLDFLTVYKSFRVNLTLVHVGSAKSLFMRTVVELTVL